MLKNAPELCASMSFLQETLFSSALPVSEQLPICHWATTEFGLRCEHDSRNMSAHLDFHIVAALPRRDS